MEPSKQDVKLVEDLSLMSKLNPGVINVLLDYVMINKQNTLPYNYVMKIASSLARENINTALDAIEYFKNYKTRNYTRVKKEDEEIEMPVTRQSFSSNDMEIDEAMELERLKRARKERKSNAAVEV